MKFVLEISLGDDLRADHAIGKVEDVLAEFGSTLARGQLQRIFTDDKGKIIGSAFVEFEGQRQGRGDLAIIDCLSDGKWKPLAYVGPSRAGGEIEFPIDSTRLRVSYLGKGERTS